MSGNLLMPTYYVTFGNSQYNQSTSPCKFCLVVSFIDLSTNNTGGLHESLTTSKGFNLKQHRIPSRWNRWEMLILNKINVEMTKI